MTKRTLSEEEIQSAVQQQGPKLVAQNPGGLNTFTVSKQTGPNGEVVTKVYLHGQGGSDLSGPQAD
jgi:hypothetical protein